MKKQEAFKERRHLHVCDLWPWGVTLTFHKIKKADVIRCRFLYCTLEPGMMSMDIMFYDISLFVYFMWPLTFTSDLQLLSRSLAVLSLDVFNVVEYFFVWRKLKWRHHDFISLLIFYEILIQICKGHIEAAYQISDWSNMRELRHRVGKMDFEATVTLTFDSRWPISIGSDSVY